MDNIQNNQVPQSKAQSQNGNKYTGVLVVVIVLVLLGAGLFYVVNSSMLGGKQEGVTPVTPVVSVPGGVTEEPKFIKPDFSYTVKSISSDVIVLDGKNGEMNLSNDPTKVTAYAGPSKDSPKMELSQIKVGDLVNLEAVPGQQVWLFVSQM